MLKRAIDQNEPDLESDDRGESYRDDSWTAAYDDSGVVDDLGDSFTRFTGFSQADYEEEELDLYLDEDAEQDEEAQEVTDSEILEGLEAHELKDAGFDGDCYKALIKSLHGRLLTKDQEQQLARTIQASDRDRQLIIFSNDFVARMCLEPLLMVKNGGREDRILEVSVTNKKERASLVAKVCVNISTISNLLDQNCDLTKKVMNRQVPTVIRKESLEQLHKNRRKIALLFRETKLRKKFINKAVEKLKEKRDDLNNNCLTNPVSDNEVFSYPKIVMRVGESRETLNKRLEKFDEITALGTSAKRELADHNIRYVIKIAKQFRGQGLPFVDLIDEGVVGLMRATEKFDPELDWKFSTYATHWIRQSIRMAIASKSRPIRVTATGIDQIQKFREMKRDLSLELGREPNEGETFARFREVFKGAKKEKKALELFNWLNVNNSSVSSLDRPLGDVDGYSLGECIFQDNRREQSTDWLECIEKSDLFNQAWEILKDIGAADPRGAEIIQLRCGLGREKAYTLQEVAHEMGVTRERIRQIEGEFIRKMKQRAIVLEHSPEERLP
jgi:RNA polymerase primary sigma factor